MAELPYSTASAAIAASFASSAYRTPSFYGGGPASSGADEPFLRFVVDYLAHHPLERDRLADQLRALLSEKAAVGQFHYAPLIHTHLATGTALEAPLHVDPMLSHAGRAHDFALLEAKRSDVASLARFSQRVDLATYYLFVAVEPNISAATWKKAQASIRNTPKGWYDVLAHESFTRWKITRDVLAHDWSVPDTVEPLYRTAFWSLCELTPADSHLKRLFDRDRYRACLELVRHVDAYADQLALAADLARTLADTDDHATADDQVVRTAAIQTALLAKAGERLTLTQAAERLGITRQALHKKIKTGNALGLMLGETFVLPSVQLVEAKGKTVVVPHLREALAPFIESGAGDWSALQYLIEPDPALGGAIPIDRLKEGHHARVVEASRAYLGLDEG